MDLIDHLMPCCTQKAAMKNFVAIVSFLELGLNSNHLWKMGRHCVMLGFNLLLFLLLLLLFLPAFFSGLFFSFKGITILAGMWFIEFESYLRLCFVPV